MPGPHIVSEAQRGLFGAELARRRAMRKRGRLSEMTEGELARHLRESRGRELPERAERRKAILEAIRRRSGRKDETS